MSENVTNYRPETLNIKCEKSHTELTLTSSWKDVADIFQFHNSKPYLIIGNSGGGKTTLCYDIMYRKASEATRIYYVSNTTVSSTNSIIDNFPNAIRSQCTIENLVKIWQEINHNMNAYYCSDTSSGSTNNGPMNTLANIYNKLIYGGNLVEQDKQWRKSVVESYPEVFKSDAQLKNMSAIVDTISKHIQRTYVDTMKQKVNENDREACFRIETDASNIAIAFCQETLIRLIINIIQVYPASVNSSSASQYTLTASELAIINGFYSEKPKTLLVIDDCTETLVSFVKDTKNKKTSIAGSLDSVSNIYNEFMKCIFTRARHANCLICIFVHQLEAIASKDSLNNIILLGTAGLTEISRSRSIPDQTKTVLSTMSNKIFNDPKYKYHFVYYNQSDDPSNVYISKATLLGPSSAVKYSPICERYYEIYDSINNNNNDLDAGAPGNNSSNVFMSPFANNSSDSDGSDSDVL